MFVIVAVVSLWSVITVGSRGRVRDGGACTYTVRKSKGCSCASSASKIDRALALKIVKSKVGVDIAYTYLHL
jgi:hypothetical protein